MNSLVRFVSRSTLVLIASMSLFAQTSSQITGTITDKSGAVVNGAAITVTSTETGNVRKAVTDESGTYTLPLLNPGDYKLQVTMQGFKSINQDSVRLEVNQTARLDFSLEPGNVTESISVNASAPLIESDTSAIGQVIETQQIENLPLNGRNFVSLATLSPGVSGVGFGAKGTIMSGTRPDDLRPASEIFANGNREGSNNQLWDGIDNNERLTLSIVVRPSVEAVREFKIQTNLFGAEQGRNSGATVNVVTKSGSNEWHGSAYDYLRNDKLDARNYFASPTAAKPTLRQNQFGASLGGKIIPNKLFFFGNYEGFRRGLERVFVNTVPTEGMRRGDFSEVRDIFDYATLRADSTAASGYTRQAFPGRQIPINRFDPIMTKMVNAYPLPQRAGLANNHTTTPRDKQRWDQGDLRLDWNWNDKNSVFGRFSRQDTTTTRPSTFAPVTLAGLSSPVSLGNEDTFAGDSALKAYHSVLNWVRTITPTFIIETKMGFNRFNLNFRQEGAAAGAKLGEKVGFINANQGPQADGIPILSPAGYTGIGQTRSLPILRIENTYNPGVSATKISGRQTFKFGVDARRRQVTQFQTNRGNGRYNFARTFTDNPNSPGNTGDAMAATLLGVPGTIEQDFTLVFPGLRTTEWGFFFQDDFKVSSKLTLNMGMRYEYDTPITEVANRWTNFDVVTGKLLIAGFNTDAATGLRADKNNFAPRFGFAYQARPGTVIRGGFGLFYNPSGSEAAYMRRHRQLPFGPINAEDINQYVANPRRVIDGFRPIPNLDFKVVADNPVGAMIAIDPNFRSGYAQQFNLQIQQQLPKDMVFKIGYVGNLGRRLDMTYDYNQPVPGPGAVGPRRPLYGIAPNVVGVTYNVFDGLSNYHSLQSTLERRFRNGIGFLSVYTWSHSIDDVANQFGGSDNGPIPQDRRFRRADRGTSGFDITHRVVQTVNYELPFGKGRKNNISNPVLEGVAGGWDTNLIANMQTGLPFTPVLANSVSNAGGSRPDRFKSGTISNPDPALWYDTSFGTSGAAWGTPALFTFGNGGRNILRGPGRVNFDWSASKHFNVTEKVILDYRLEVFNLFNTPQFDLPNSSIGNPAAGRITSTIGNNRQMQMGLRLSF